MRRGEMGDTPEHLVPHPLMHGGDGGGETKRQRTAINVRGWIMPLSKALVLNWWREESMEENM